jgi:hypothetical protein
MPTRVRNSTEFPLNKGVYAHEWMQLDPVTQNDLFSLFYFYEYIVSEDHNPEETFESLNSWARECYLKTFETIKQKGLSNLRSFWGRKYNMFANIPKSFEIYQGRIYDVGY